jgi:hypothetical protein
MSLSLKIEASTFWDLEFNLFSYEGLLKRKRRADVAVFEVISNEEVLG